MTIETSPAVRLVGQESKIIQITRLITQNTGAGGEKEVIERCTWNIIEVAVSDGSFTVKTEKTNYFQLYQKYLKASAAI